MGIDKIKKEFKKINNENHIIRLYYQDGNYTEYDTRNISKDYKNQFLSWFILNADTTANIKVDCITTY